MGDCVKREDIINALHNIGGCGADIDTWAEGWDKAIDEAIRIVQNMPAAEASPITGELKPCPFCGGEAVLINTRAFGESCKSVMCIKCRATVSNFAGDMQEERATEAWNRRNDNA